MPRVPDDRPSEPGRIGFHIGATIVSAGATGLAIVHAVFPHAPIDSITLALLGVAAVPWLFPFLKSAKLPGGYELEFREFEKRVERQISEGVERVDGLATRVEKAVERFEISGARTVDAEERLNAALAGFYAYLKEIGFDVSEKPSVHIEDDLEAMSFYDLGRRRIVLSRSFIDEDLVYRDYGHHVLHERVQAPTAASTEAREAIESGLADYYLCSYKDDPVIGRKSASVLRERRLATAEFIRDLTTAETVETAAATGPFSHLVVGGIWGAAFWEIRKSVGKAIADRVLRAAWEAEPSSQLAFASGLVDAVSAATDVAAGKHAREALDRRGLGRARTVGKRS